MSAPVQPSAADILKEYPKPSGMTPAHYAKMQELCGKTWIDVLFHLPTRVLDRSATPTVAAAPVGERATVLANVVKRPPLPPRNVKRPMSIELSDGTAPLRAVYFHAGAWLERAFVVGEQVILSGKVEVDNKGKKMLHPDVWRAGKALDNIARVWPLYPLTAGIGQGWVTRGVAQALQFLQGVRLPEWLPPELRETAPLNSMELPGFGEALRAVHNPATEQDVLPAAPARVRLALDELFATQIALVHARRTTQMMPGLVHGGKNALSERLRASLPWALTADQETTLQEILQDLETPTPMLRLVQGDVGSGKTIVALLALLHVMENGRQGVLMAPTEILARQHYEAAKKLLEPLGITVGLLVGSLSAAVKKRTKQHVAEGFVNLLVGTHAVVEDDVVFDRLGLAVIDEQHRFGVRQRMALSRNQELPPDILVMTATPIPRTLALTAYGDMAVSNIRSKPPGRTPIVTSVLPAGRLGDVALGLRRVLEAGEQVYWVCPLVEESEESDLTAATERFETLEKHYGTAVGLLHGKMKAADKDEVMARFKAGDIRILVATTVIEVGVDVPNATLMVIEHAERFGLAQLHQLRGRVGRGAKASKCVLMYSSPLGEYGKERLEALRTSEDGFYLAEQDLRLRGPGEILGTRQSGETATRLADLYHHAALIPLARDAAEAVLGGRMSPQQRSGVALLLLIFNKQAAAEFLRSG